MKKKTKTASMLRDELFERYPCLTVCEKSIDAAYYQLLQCYKSGGKLLIAGNGGSCADSDHITGELMKSFLFRRKLEPRFEQELKCSFGEKGAELAAQLEGGLPAISLPSMTAINTAYANDVSSQTVFAQLVHTLGNEHDVFWGISTSGNSKNIALALMTARANHMKSICLTGQNSGSCAQLCDICIQVPERETFKIQELHLPVYHALCAMLEAELFAER